MDSISICDICGKPSNVHMKDIKGTCNLCFNCHNKRIAKLLNLDEPNNAPERLTIADNYGEYHEFKIEFMITGTGKSLTAYEIGENKRKVDVWGSHEDDFNEMLRMLKARIEKALSVEYMDQHGKIKDQKLVGHIEYDSNLGECVIFVDGKPYTWAELGENIPIFEGWKIKIEFGDVGEELD